MTGTPTTPEADANYALLSLLAMCRHDRLSEVLRAILDSEWLKDRDASAFAAGRTQALEEAAQIVRSQANLPDLMHFDRPSDFRKGVLSCLAALEAAAAIQTGDK